MAIKRYELNDEQWSRVAPLLPGKASDPGRTGSDIRQTIAARGAEAVIPPSSSRVRQISYDRQAYKARNLVERLWCRLKDWRRIATRYDKLGRNFLSATLIAAEIIYRCN